MNNTLTKELFAAFTDTPTAVEVPEWNATVYLKPMSGLDRLTWLKGIAEHEDDGQLNMHHLLVRCLCDEHGNRLLSDEDVAIVGSKSATVLQRLCDIALAINHLGEKAADTAKKD